MRPGECRETTGQSERGLETLCAFLDGAGGAVLSFGATDNGKTAGQEVQGGTKRMPADGINRLEPPATVRLSCVSVPDSNEYQAAGRL